MDPHAYEARTPVSEKASIAVVIVRRAISRGTGLPETVRPFTVTVASLPDEKAGHVVAVVSAFPTRVSLVGRLQQHQRMRVRARTPCSRSRRRGMAACSSARQ